jgi:hypothetical protein
MGWGGAGDLNLAGTALRRFKLLFHGEENLYCYLVDVSVITTCDISPKRR